MKRLGRMIVAATAVAQVALAGHAMADAAKYPPKGLIKSGSQAGVGATPVVVIDNAVEPNTAAASGKVFLLSQACFRVDALNTVTLTAGPISVSFVASNSNGGAGCQSFAPGYVIPEGTNVTCAATTTAAFSCTVSGVVVKKQ